MSISMHENIVANQFRNHWPLGSLDHTRQSSEVKFILKIVELLFPSLCLLLTVFISRTLQCGLTSILYASFTILYILHILHGVVHVIELTWVDGLYSTQAQLLDVDPREDGSNSRYLKMQNIYCHSYLLTSLCTQVYRSAKSFKQFKHANLGC
jgi:hypothetical protein